MKNERIETFIGKLDDGRHVVKNAAGQIKIEASQSDWSRVNALSDADINKAVAEDDDWKDVGEIDWSKANIVVPEKKSAISIRVDEDILNYFKAGGPGYQRRIHAVLRSFVDHLGTGRPTTRKPRKANR